MSRYIKVEDAIEAAISGCASWDGGYFPSMDEPIKEEFEAVNDKCIDLVRCGECRRAIPFSVAGNRDAFCHCDLFDATMTRKDFCNYGERKENEDADR